jgi:hypothetical protein
MCVLWVVPYEKEEKQIFLSISPPHFLLNLIRSLEIAFHDVMKALMEINPSSPPSV